MQLYDAVIDEIKIIQDRQAAEGKLKDLVFCENNAWPDAGRRNLVLQSDTAIELGNPTTESVSLALWTETVGRVNDNRITLVGPDISATTKSQLPFGKIVLIEGSGFDEENAYDRYREIDLVRFDLSLKGYMMRATSQYMREWSRISKESVKNGFSFSILASTLISELKKIDYVKSVEVIFLTSTVQDVARFKPMAQKVDSINKALSKMMAEMSFDCADCEYEEVCDEVSALRNMRKNHEKE